MIRLKITTILGIATLLGSGVPFKPPTVSAQTPPPLLAQVKVEIFVLPTGPSNYQNYARVKHRDSWGRPYPGQYFYSRDRYPQYRYRGNSYCSPYQCYNQNPTRFIQRDYWGNPVFSNQRDVLAPTGLKGRTFNYRGW